MPNSIAVSVSTIDELSSFRNKPGITTNKVDQCPAKPLPTNITHSNTPSFANLPALTRKPPTPGPSLFNRQGKKHQLSPVLEDNNQLANSIVKALVPALMEAFNPKKQQKCTEQMEDIDLFREYEDPE